MAIATKRPSFPPPAPSAEPSRSGLIEYVEIVFDKTFRFLASLKLAVFTLATVAAVLAAGTYVESRYGTVAVQEWVYRSWWFAIVLAFLATNILCAALIRFPWTKRQTGFVITHAGLLTVLAGSFWSLQFADEGQVGLKEGETTDKLMRPNHSVIRLREVDPHTRKPLHDFEYLMSFHPGAWPWGSGRYEVLSDPKDPFKLAVKNHLTASSPRYLHEPMPNGSPMLKLGLFGQLPNRVRETDLFAEAFSEDATDVRHWFIADNRALRDTKPIGVALLAFQYLPSDDMVDSFLHPPEKLGMEGVALIRYKDHAGHSRVETWPIDSHQAGQFRELPGSDFRVSFEETAQLPPDASVRQMTGDPVVTLAVFKVRQGDQEAVSHFGWAWLPMLPSVMPDSGKELVHIDYLPPLPPGTMGMIEVAAVADGRVFYRAFNKQGLKGSSELTLGEKVPALGGGNMPMSISLRAEKFLSSGRERLVYEQLDLPVGKLEQGIPGALVELTVDGETKQLWVRRSGGLDPIYGTVVMPGGRTFEVAYDIDRKPLGFEITLDDFDVGFDPGTAEPSSYRSDIRLTDEGQGIKNKPIGIWMNHTMTHRDLTFYQSNFVAIKDPRTDRPTGEYVSIFQVAYDPGRPLKYMGCILVGLGAFVQFYMRAGLFSDGGKRERAQAASKAAKLAQKNEVARSEESSNDLESL
jgi:ResB-like family